MSHSPLERGQGCVDESLFKLHFLLLTPSFVSQTPQYKSQSLVTHLIIDILFPFQ